ncbi:MAG: bifunctional adenosylcobinamide kinase/adenosylcobinamide-phosphate guanylyltransferase [Novosphingobium sp.]
MAPVTLLLGGARSGKSRFAQQWAEDHPGPLVYIATATASDGEMADRIARHRHDRGERWLTVEEEIDLPAALTACQAEAGAIVVDCITLWLSNLMLGGHDVDAGLARLVDALRRLTKPVYVVSNEVGSGIVPEYPLGRAFRDEAGRVNQQLAQCAARVTLIVAGLPLWLKGQALPSSAD